jgi:hypothetical protein
MCNGDYKGAIRRYVSVIRRVGNPFTPHRNSVTPRVGFEGAAVFVFQKDAGLDQTPATFLPTFPP